MILLKCHESTFHGWTVQLTILEDIPEESFSNYSLFRFKRYEARLQKLESIIGYGDAVTVCGIEGYSYSSRPTQADSILKELGGCLRRDLCRLDYNITEIPPSTIKKYFTGMGNAKKLDMYKWWRNEYKLPCLYRLLGLCQEDKTLPEKDIPHPIEDIVDSFAVALTTLALTNKITL